MIEVVKSIIEKDGEYLLLKRSSSSKFFPKLWDLPGGKIKPGEEIKAALIRETKEETSLKIIPGEKIGDYKYKEKENKIHFQIFKIGTYIGNLRLSKDHSASAWVSKEDLDKYNLAPIVKLFFKKRI